MCCHIDEELVCIEALIHHLKVHCGVPDVPPPERVEQQQQPPDFWISVDGKRSPVEVTSIASKNELQCAEQLRRFAKSVQASAEAKNVISGTYLVVMSDMNPLPKPGSKGWQKLVCKAVKFVSATQCVTAGCDEELVSGGRLYIWRESAQGKLVEDVPTSVKWKRQIGDEVCQLMQNAVENKREKLRQFDSGSVLLALYDAHAMGYADVAQETLLKVRGYHWFHSVFWAASFTDRPNTLYPEQPGREGTFLYSRNRKWWKGPDDEQ